MDILKHIFGGQVASHWFKNTYEGSVSQYLAGIDRLNCQPVETKDWPILETPELVTHTAWIGRRDAVRVLVLISGTHGVEGYCGSAVQSCILEEFSQDRIKLELQQAVLMIHALNPWGMKWARRCDQEGIDLNRNFIDFGKKPESHPLFQEFAAALACENKTERDQRLHALLATMGQTEFDIMVSGGQYLIDWAPFYGGQGPAFANPVMDEIIQDWGLEGRQTVVVDLHSGLGPWAYGEVISDHPIESSGSEFASRLFGQALAETARGESFSVPKEGLLDYRWHQLMNDSGCFVTLEFGTYSKERLFQVLCDEHGFWKDFKEVDANDSSYLKRRSAMLHHFCPDDLLWQQAVLFKGWQVVSQVLEYHRES
ncbi:DUF2817 domain-containing protein [Pseudobacteriovorax antillogorgiicola]|uniref:Zinc carboxypeptidase n=1 Tax=Pseudobacteriovorax antillogorgiicola TaxID=1513793 RepID=A0A1Y6BEW3_9BACT|nr:DUF2817 domain-containing protein [Pseudobacteriovorax antillogorgiicola]TCS56366.1 uncharacterized protein DUF2817 [Pseudobacteriovorax antillogorgiicola]SMF06643.1 Protein of unknown function [Pseudobacteriovorax antillogorgiicola]